MKNEKLLYVCKSGWVYYKSTYKDLHFTLCVLPNDELMSDTYKGDSKKVYYADKNIFNDYDVIYEQDLDEVPLTYIGEDTISTRYLEQLYNKLLENPTILNSRFSDCYEYILNELALNIEEREAEKLKSTDKLAETIAGAGIYLAQMLQGRKNE